MSRQADDKPLSEPMMTQFTEYVLVTRQPGAAPTIDIPYTLTLLTIEQNMAEFWRRDLTLNRKKSPKNIMHICLLLSEVQTQLQ